MVAFPGLFLVMLLAPTLEAKEVKQVAIQVTASDFMALADSGVLGSPAEAEKIWTALRARQHTKGELVEAEKDAEAVSSIAGAVKDLQHLLSLTNLLYGIASTLLTAVFSFLLYLFREAHAVQGTLAFGYAIVFIYWGLQLLAIGAVSDTAAPGSSGSRLVGGLLLMVPNIAAGVIGLAATEIATGRRLTELIFSWQQLPTPKALAIDGHFACSVWCVAGSIMLYSGALFAVSSFPLLLVPLLGSVYILSISACVLLFRQMTAAVWGSVAHSLLLWCIAHLGAVPEDLKLGLIISACNSGFWSIPYMLCVLPMGIISDDGVLELGSNFQERDFAGSIATFVQVELWGRLSFGISLCCYSLGNIGMLCTGLKLQSWVPVPYALIGISITMYAANKAPPRLRMVLRLFYNLPMAFVLFAVSSQYGRITDALWLGVLAWLGHPQHFQIVAIFLVRALVLLCAMWSLWYGLSRLFPGRLLQDLEEYARTLTRETERLTELRATLATLQQTAQNEEPPRRHWLGGLFRRNADAMPRQDGGGNVAAADRARLVEELQCLEMTEPSRQRQQESLRRWRVTLPSWLIATTIIPLGWAGYSVSAAVCDAPEPFGLLQLLLNANAVWYLFRVFGGLVLNTFGERGNADGNVYREWREPVSMKIAVPLLFAGGMRGIAMAEDSHFRNLAGLTLLASGFVGLLRSQGPVAGSLIGASVSVAMMACGLLCDVRMLVVVGVVCLYSLGIILLCATMGHSTVTVAGGITAVALGTMHLGMSYEAYFLALQNVGNSMPFSTSLHALAAQGGIEKRLSLKLVRMFGNVLAL